MKLTAKQRHNKLIEVEKLKLGLDLAKHNHNHQRDLFLGHMMLNTGLVVPIFIYYLLQENGIHAIIMGLTYLGFSMYNLYQYKKSKKIIDKLYSRCFHTCKGIYDALKK